MATYIRWPAIKVSMMAFLLFFNPLSGHPLLSGHSPFPGDWPFNTGSMLVQCHTEEIKYPLVTFFYGWGGEGVVSRTT